MVQFTVTFLVFLVGVFAIFLLNTVIYKNKVQEITLGHITAAGIAAMIGASVLLLIGFDLLPFASLSLYFASSFLLGDILHNTRVRSLKKRPESL